MIQSIKDIDNIIRWAVDTDGEKFARDMYRQDGVIDSYTREKFIKMQTNFIGWVAELDSGNRDALKRAINKYSDKENK